MGTRKDYWNFFYDCLQKDEIIKFVQSIQEVGITFTLSVKLVLINSYLLSFIGNEVEKVIKKGLFTSFL